MNIKLSMITVIIFRSKGVAGRQVFCNLSARKKTKMSATSQLLHYHPLSKKLSKHVFQLLREKVPQETDTP